MTTTVIVHNGHRSVTVKIYDRVWDADRQLHTDAWNLISASVIPAGQLWQGYCTNSRKIEVVEEEQTQVSYDEVKTAVAEYEKSHQPSSS